MRNAFNFEKKLNKNNNNLEIFGGFTNNEENTHYHSIWIRGLRAF